MLLSDWSSDVCSSDLRFEVREYDIVIHRPWLYPTLPVTEVVTKPAHGVIITSATLKGGGDWDTAEARSGSQHLLRPPARFEAHSPFNYAAQAEVLIVTDIKKGDIAAMRSEEHTSELQSLMRISYAVFCLKKKKTKQ